MCQKCLSFKLTFNLVLCKVQVTSSHGDIAFSGFSTWLLHSDCRYHITYIAMCTFCSQLQMMLGKMSSCSEGNAIEVSQIAESDKTLPCLSKMFLDKQCLYGDMCSVFGANVQFTTVGNMTRLCCSSTRCVRLLTFLTQACPILIKQIHGILHPQNF